MIEELMTTLGLPKDGNGWIVQVFVVVFLVLLLNFIQKRVFLRIAKQASKTANPWDDALIRAIIKPLSLLIWVVGLTFAAEMVQGIKDQPIFSALAPLRDVGVIFALAWFLIRFIGETEKNLVSLKRVDVTTASAFAKLLRVSVMITSVLVALQTLGFSVSGVLAFGGIGGLAVGLAAKDLLANFFGGLMIHLDRPFSIGDWVRSPDKNIEGTVEEIGWRLTKIRTFDKRPLYVPNATFTTISVENPSRMSHRRIYETVGIRYDDIGEMPSIVADVEAMLRSHPEIDTSQTLMVNFNQFSDSSVDFFVYTFTHTTNWVKFHTIKQDVLLKISDIIAQHDAEIAFPTSTLHLADSPQFSGEALSGSPLTPDRKYDHE
ncbi:MAG: mechanosensitive ion channel family protein [Gammaproteobacteria bacterium]|nr:mechanosensitive ion channel family protein [Gammaproteobacteria bacterium]MCF6229420.1 mechanosensitive ion channel family protein [Gammaproteobacteria bacterium]